MAKAFWVCVLMTGATAVLGGCARVEVPAVPDIPGWGSSPPPTKVIPPADPNSLGDLRRENDQLRARIAYLEHRNDRLARKYRDLEGDMQEVKADMDKIAAERDRYKSRSGR